MASLEEGGKEEELFALERVELSDDSDDDFKYDELKADEFAGLEEEDMEYIGADGAEDAGLDDGATGDEDLETALASIKAASATVRPPHAGDASLRRHPQTAVRPSVVDDFIRNFLIARKMDRTLDSFNTEWYEKQAKGQLKAEDIGVVPDIYMRNLELDEQVKTLQIEVEKMKEIASKAQGTWDKFRKERDFHRMHHKRVVQEKNKLVVDMKRLRKHYSAYEPTMAQLREKYELAMKEKMLMRLERDRMSSKVEQLEAHVRTVENAQSMGGVGAAAGEKSADGAQKSGEMGSNPGPKGGRRRRKGADSALPKDGQTANPFWNLDFPPSAADRAQLAKTFKGHQNSVAGLAFHPTKQIVATVSDDETWKLWAMPSGDLIMSGEGHKDWVAGVEFHPRGTHLATSSGDGTVKIWDFATASCAVTFTDHTQPVWSVAFHHDGDFLVSSSMDHTAKLWDLSSKRCRQTFRGHVDSVNHVCFQPYSNIICTASGDKTVSLWDCRSGLCVQTFYGHMNACNHTSFNLRGDAIASCDSDGVVKLWDVRMASERTTLSGGQHSLNRAVFDKSGTVVAAACDDGTIKIFKTDAEEGAGAHVADLRGHEDAVQSVIFDPSGKYIVSGSSDATFRLWAIQG